MINMLHLFSVSLTQTQKKGLELKQKVLEEVSHSSNQVYLNKMASILQMTFSNES